MLNKNYYKGRADTKKIEAKIRIKSLKYSYLTMTRWNTFNPFKEQIQISEITQKKISSERNYCTTHNIEHALETRLEFEWGILAAKLLRTRVRTFV
jgi:hypothetical protein